MPVNPHHFSFFKYDTTMRKKQDQMFDFLIIILLIGKNSFDYINPEFGEIGCENPEKVQYAMLGLDNFGFPMVNPITGKESLFAFTGDRITDAGWLDHVVDVRSLLTINPHNLLPNGTITLNFARVIEKRENQLSVIQNLIEKVDLVCDQSNLWNFE